MMNNIPIFEALISDFKDGIYKISLVDMPALESNFLVFKQKQIQKFSVEDESQHIVKGVIMRADFPIYRYDKNYGEYFLRFSKDTIKQMSEKMLKSNTFNNINLMHMDGTDVEGVQLQQLFIKDKANGIDPSGFDDIEDGSLFGIYKVENEMIWNQIKLGTFLGFSIEGLFTLELVASDLAEKFNKKTTYNTFMNKLFKKIMKSTVKFGYAVTDKGTIYWVGDAELAVGDEVFYDNETEEYIKAEDGEYVLEDGTKVIVSDGVVTEINTNEEPVNEDVEMEEEIIVEEPSETPTEEEVIDIAEEKAAEMVDPLKDEIEALKQEIEAIKATLAELMSQPATEPIVEEFNKQANKTTKVGDKKMDNVLRILSQKK